MHKRRILVTLFLLALAGGLLAAGGCAGMLYGSVKADDAGLRQVKKIALVAYTLALPVEGSGGYGLARVGALDEGGMAAHGRALATEAADRFDNALREGLKQVDYIPLANVRDDDLYRAMVVPGDTGKVAAARGTVDLIRFDAAVDLPAVQKVAAKLGADAVILVYNTFRFFKDTGWYASVEPAEFRVYSAAGRELFAGRISYRSDRWDIARSEELDLPEEQHLLRSPVEESARWLIKELKQHGA